MSSENVFVDLTAAAERGFMGCVLLSKTPGALLALVPVDAICDGSLRWAHTAATAAVADGHADLDPLVVADAARRHHITPPGAIGRQVLTFLHRLRIDAPVPDLGAWYAALANQEAARRGLRDALSRLLDVIDTGELSEVAELVQREIGAAMATVAAAGVNHG